MQSKTVPVRLVIIIAAAAAAVAIAVAMVTSFQGTAANEQGGRFNVKVTSPDAVTMARGETRAVQIKVDVISAQPSDARVWVYSTDSPAGGASGTGDPEQQFEALRQNGLAPGFTGTLDDEEFSLPSSSQDPASRTVNLNLTAAGDMEPGDYYFVHSTLIKSGESDYISHGTFRVTVT